MSDPLPLSEQPIADVFSAIVEAAKTGQSALVCRLIEPRFEEWLAIRPVDPMLLNLIVSAAREVGWVGMIARIAAGLDDAYWQMSVHPGLISLLRNSSVVYNLSSGSETFSNKEIGLEEWWIEALSATSEVRLVRALDRALQTLTELDPPTIDRLVVLAALARANAWSAAYRHAQHLLIGATSSERLPYLADSWTRHGLSSLSAGSLVAHSVRRRGGDVPEAAWRAALAQFAAFPDIDTAQAVWRMAESQSRLGTMVRGAPLSSATRVAAVERIVAGHPTGMKPLWVYMTWREGADRLLGLIASYIDDNTRIVVSVGGDGRPDDLERASAILLADRVHMIARPVVTWGGQKLLFQNVLPVLETFRRRTAGEAWFSIVCDRSFPLRGLARFSQRLGDERVMAVPAKVETPPAWHREWDEATVQDLPAKVLAAVNELFESGTARSLKALVGQDVDYLPPGNYRLDQCHFNFASTAQSVTGESFKAQTYAISPFNTDFRWMSLARLAEFVDTGTEGGATYARGMHPWMMQWVHSVLKTQNLRIGDPFFVASRNYADHLLTNPERFALFAAMNGGLGPEMNFFDTYAWSNGLQKEFYHLFSRQPIDLVDREAIDPVFDHADSSGHQFVRKITADPGNELLKLLTRRVVDDSAWDSFHWAVAEPDAESKMGNPVPCLDQHLMTSLIGIPLTIRDLLDQHRQPAKLQISGVVTGDNTPLGRWSYESDVLTINFADDRLGTKRYRSIGADAERLTLVPDEIVDVYNGWSAFLEFALANLRNSTDVIACLNVEDVLLDRELSWTGGPKEDSNMLAALASSDRSTPLPVFGHQGQAIEIRGNSAETLVLARIAEQPALLKLRGAARAGTRTIALLSASDPADLEAWHTMPTQHPIYELRTEMVPGSWLLETYEEEREIELHANGTITCSEGDVLGRWLAREDGLLLLGLDQLRIALSTQLRVRDGCWRFSGWAKRNMQEMQSFALRQLPPRS
jgi:hypothetical protein